MLHPSRGWCACRLQPVQRLLLQSQPVRLFISRLRLRRPQRRSMDAAAVLATRQLRPSRPASCLWAFADRGGEPTRPAAASCDARCDAALRRRTSEVALAERSTACTDLRKESGAHGFGAADCRSGDPALNCTALHGIAAGPDGNHRRRVNA